MPHMKFFLMIFTNILQKKKKKKKKKKRTKTEKHQLNTDRNHYENIPIHIYWKFYHQKKGKLQIKNLILFHISAQHIDCRYSLEPPRRGGSNEYPQSMFLSRNKKNNVYPCKPQFYYIKVGFKGVIII